VHCCEPRPHHVTSFPAQRSPRAALRGRKRTPRAVRTLHNRWARAWVSSLAVAGENVSPAATEACATSKPPWFRHRGPEDGVWYAGNVLLGVGG
jgi:hypothetical protein